MKDEIKEIFNINELFEEWEQFLSWCYENNDKTVEIHRDKLKWAMDYITNLQEENKVLLEKYSTIQILYNSSKLKNDKAIEYIKDSTFTEYKHKIHNLERLMTIKCDLLNILQGGNK